MQRGWFKNNHNFRAADASGYTKHLYLTSLRHVGFLKEGSFGLRKRQVLQPSLSFCALGYSGRLFLSFFRSFSNFSAQDSCLFSTVPCNFFLCLGLNFELKVQIKNRQKRIPKYAIPFDLIYAVFMEENLRIAQNTKPTREHSFPYVLHVLSRQGGAFSSISPRVRVNVFHNEPKFVCE